MIYSVNIGNDLNTTITLFVYMISFAIVKLELFHRMKLSCHIIWLFSAMLILRTNFTTSHFGTYVHKFADFPTPAITIMQAFKYENLLARTYLHKCAGNH